MNLKICIIIIAILLIIISRKLILGLIGLFKKTYKDILKKSCSIIGKFIFKSVEIFWIIVLSLVMLIPVFSYYVMNKMYNTSYNEYKDLLEIVLKSNYVIIIGIIIIVYLFRNEIKEKIAQLKEFNGNGFKFETQLEKNLKKSKPEEENCDIILEESCDDTLEKNNEIYDKIKNEISNEKTVEEYEKSDKNKIYELEEQLKAKDKIIKRNQFIFIREHVAKTTNRVLIYMYEKYKTANNLFKKDELKNILKNSFENEKIKFDLDLEIKAIIQFLLRNKIIDTEDDKNYCITEYGVEFLEFLFEGRC